MTEQTSERYSDKRLNAPFDAYVLLSERLTFRPAEIIAALRDDYPGLAWSDTAEDDRPFTTGEGAVSVLRPDAREADAAVVQLHSGAGPCDIDWPPVIARSHLTFPDAEAAVAAHRCYLHIAIGSPDRSLAARFDAARRLSCVAALFAELPICTGVYFPSADHLVKPEDWVAAAQTAMRGEVPLLQWISLCVVPLPDGQSPTPVTAGTIGLAAFNGHEVALPMARVPPGDAARWVAAATTMLLERGHRFRDSDTMDVEGDPLKLRVRHASEGQHGMPTDTWVLLHPESILDEDAVFGARGGTPPPQGRDNGGRGDAGALKRRLHALVAGGGRKRG